MADPQLVQALDYILNRSDASSIEVIAEAVVRRRRNMAIFNALGDIPDPEKMAKELSQKINEGTNIGMETMRSSIREMILRIIKEHAPELDSAQAEELIRSWMPGGKADKEDKLPADVLLSMVEQFVSFSHGTMNKSTDEDLRNEMGAWPQRYWKAFPPAVRGIVSDYLKNKITEKDFKNKLVIALGVK